MKQTVLRRRLSGGEVRIEVLEGCHGASVYCQYIIHDSDQPVKSPMLESPAPIPLGALAQYVEGKLGEGYEIVKEGGT